MKATRNSTMAAAALGLLAAVALPAAAESVTEVTAPRIGEEQRVTVGYADLDLNSVEGQEVLHYRIANAARKVCGSSDLRRAGSLQMANRNEECFESSLSRAMAQIPGAQVAASSR